MKNLITLILLIISNTVWCETVVLFFDNSIPQHEFAANDIKVALEKRSYTVEFKRMSDLNEKFKGKKVVIAKKNSVPIVNLLTEQGGFTINELSEQAYALRTTNKTAFSYWILGGDVNGAMYGGLQLAEYINFNGFTGSINEEDSPHIKNRGIKFNIPLDKLSPTYYYNNDGSSHKEAIKHVWDMSFWTEWFDEMARHRYNVLSLWSPHPFTSMLNMEDEYPGIAIQGVTGYDENGNDLRINNMTIDEKVKFWQQVMKYGKDRGFDIYFCTWNIFLTTAEGKHGLTNKPDNQLTRTYLKKCTKKFLETYPDLKGLGLTVGENMSGIDDKQKEEWAWETYGMGMMEYAKANPQRNLVFIHRQHDGGLTDILEYFKPMSAVPNIKFELSFKYSEAHAHSTVTPGRWYRTKMEEGLSNYNLKSWLTVRNDDWYFLHWADPTYVRDYINHFPDVDKFISGFYIGADGWVFSREFINKDPYYKNINSLCVQRTWYMQKLWGRIAYNPSVSDDMLKKHLAFKYPEVSSAKLFDAWSNASAAIRLANEQVTGEWDLDNDWWPEGWTGDSWKKETGRFFSLEETRKATPFKGSALCSFSKTVAGECGNNIPAWETISKIDEMATRSLDLLSKLDAGSNTELKLTLKDITAQANLGLYNAYKFRAVMYVEQNEKEKAREAIGTAYCFWLNYTNIMDELYIGATMQRNHDFSNWHDHDADALKDYTDLGGIGEPVMKLTGR